VLSPEDLKDALILEATNMSSSYFENLGNGDFKLDTLPTTVQFAPVRGMLNDDVNGDGNLDVVLIGNDYGNEVFAGRYDAMTGVVLAGDGKGKFNSLSSASTGFYISGDAKALIKLNALDKSLYIASQNRDSLKVFSNRTFSPTFKPKPGDQWAEFSFADGKKQRVEFYYGSGYLSQSTRAVTIPKGATEIIVYDSKGNSRKESLVNQ
jgi:enediyne biosynthesis protein E4